MRNPILQQKKPKPKREKLRELRRKNMDVFFKEWWDSGREDPDEFSSLVQQYADAVRMLEIEECAARAADAIDAELETAAGESLREHVRANVMRSNALAQADAACGVSPGAPG